jgi:GTP cyclohydrolase FolE2
MTSRPTSFPEDLQAARPAMAIALSKAGVNRSAKAIRIRHADGEHLFQAQIDCFADLGRSRRACTCRGSRS